jgi:hydrogenase-4 membrane subunit HyfE
MTKKKGQYSKFVVTAVISMNIVFTVAVLYVFLRTGSEPSTLITAWFAFTTGELFMLSSIKKIKEKKKGSGEK